MEEKDLQDLERGQPNSQSDTGVPDVPCSTDNSQTLGSFWTTFSTQRLIAALAVMKRYLSRVFSKTSSVLSDEDSSDNEPEFLVRQVHKSPKGYPMLATFLDSEDQFSIYRKFGYLASRLILEKQDDLRQLESELECADKSEGKRCPARLETRQRFEGQAPNRKQILIEKIEGKFLEYCKLVPTIELCKRSKGAPKLTFWLGKILRYAREVAGFNKPTARERKAVQTWLENVQPLYTAEQSFVRCREDLVSLRSGREHASLDGAVEWLIRNLRCPPLTWLFQSKETRAKSNGENGERYVTPTRVEFAANMLLTLMILALLIVPIYFLFYLNNRENQTAVQVDTAGQRNQSTPTEPRRFDRVDAACIGILLISTLAFSATVTFFTSARRQEIIGASAAYCAVLVVFVSNLGTGSGVAT